MRRALPALLVIIAAACGGDTTAPGSSTPVAFLTLSIDRDTLLTRETLSARVSLRDENHAVLTDRAITWTSSDSSVVSVSRGGVLTALRAGTATITAASGGVSDSSELAVRSLRFVDLALGSEVSCGLEATGDLWCWGSVPSTGFGNGSSKSVPTSIPLRAAVGHRFTAVALAGNYACGIEQGSVLCWGGFGATLPGSAMAPPHFTPEPIAGLPTATAIAVGAWPSFDAEHFACAIVTGGQVQCWGVNSDGQLGDGTRTGRTTPAPVPGISGATAISAGQTQACALVGTAVSCWGSDFQGELGHDTTYDRLSPVRGGVGPAAPPAWGAVTAREVHTCALAPAGETWCWGRFATGTHDGLDILAEYPVAQAAGHQFVRLADGGRTQCGLEADGDVWCWIYGHEPIRFPSAVPFTDVAASWREACALDAAGTAHCMNPWYSGATPPTETVTGAPPMVRLAADDGIVCGLTAAGGVWCWTGGDTGPAGAPAVLASGAMVFSSIWSGGGGVCALTAAGDAWCNQRAGAALALESAGNGLSAIAKSFTFACGLTTGGAALCWDHGSHNANGQLGDGTRTPHAEPAPVAGGLSFTSLAIGDMHACGMTAAGSVYCWGQGFWGAMGDGTSPRSRSPVPVSGNHAFSALASGGGLVTCGRDAGGAAVCWPRPAATVPGVQFTSVAARSSDGCGLDPAGAAYCWTGRGTGWAAAAVLTAQRFTLIRAGGSITCGITEAGSTWCWGPNGVGSLGSPDAAGLASSDVPVRVYGSE